MKKTRFRNYKKVPKMCTKCGVIKKLTEFDIRKTAIDGRMSRCKVCRVEDNKKWRQNNPQFEKKRYAKDKNKIRNKHLKRKYGITFREYNLMHISQNGKCAICGNIEQENRLLAVDHDHNTGQIRGLLCVNCNRMIGYARENIETLQNAVKYLRSLKELRKKYLK